MSPSSTALLEECGRSLVHLVMLRSGPRVTKVASVACRDMRLARASEVFLWTIMRRAGECGDQVSVVSRASTHHNNNNNNNHNFGPEIVL